MLAFLTLLLLQSSRPSPAAPPVVELVESAPVETSLDHPHIRNTEAVWRELIDGATSRLDFAEFYASDLAERRTALTPVIEAIERAAARGVRVRFLAEKKFQKTYPDTLARLGRAAGVEVRILDLEPLTGGVLHAKYFLVDSAVTFVGSQNLDWRSLEHIQELGACVRSPQVCAAYRAVFDADWALAGGQRREPAMKALAGAWAGLPKEDAWGAVTPVFSPRELLPDDSLWDLPRILALIDRAQRSVRVQLLTYAMTGRDGEYFAELENALRRAAARGIRVQLLLADWCMRKGTIEGLQSLEPLPGIDVKLVTIPAWSGGFVPYARVCHAKYLVVDGSSAWLGTSNWEKGYFHQSRNAGLLLSGPVVRTMDALFTELWRSDYAQPVDPARAYVAPRIAESVPASRPAPEAIRVGVVVENGTYNSELMAPIDVFQHTVFHHQPGMKVFTVAPTREPVRTFEGQRILPDFSYADAPGIDVLVVPSAESHLDARKTDARTVAFVRERGPGARCVLSLCDGAFVLARAGLLDGRACTTFPGDVAELRRQFPGLDVRPGLTFVADGRVVTGAGGARSYEPALFVVDRLLGNPAAVGVGKGLVIDWDLRRVSHLEARAAGGRAFSVGDRVPLEVVVEDAAGQEQPLLGLASPDAKVLLVFLFGGGEGKPVAQRGGLWCEDSLADLPLLRHVQARFGSQGVQVIPIACPPVFHEEKFGFAKGAFGSPVRAEDRAAFVAATERAQGTGVLPFAQVWFDPRLRLLGRRESASVWEGRFRADGETQTYGTPTLWILSRTGEVLCPPFFGNNHEQAKDLAYTAREVDAALAAALAR